MNSIALADDSTGHPSRCYLKQQLLGGTPTARRSSGAVLWLRYYISLCVVHVVLEWAMHRYQLGADLSVNPPFLTFSWGACISHAVTKLSSRCYSGVFVC